MHNRVVQTQVSVNQNHTGNWIGKIRVHLWDKASKNNYNDDSQELTVNHEEAEEMHREFTAALEKLRAMMNSVREE